MMINLSYAPKSAAAPSALSEMRVSCCGLTHAYIIAMLAECLHAFIQANEEHVA